MIGGWGSSCEIALIWMSLDLNDDQSTLVQVMACCRQATGHYLSKCWPRSLSPYGVTRPQWVKLWFLLVVSSGDRRRICRVWADVNTCKAEIKTLAIGLDLQCLQTCIFPLIGKLWIVDHIFWLVHARICLSQCRFVYSAVFVSCKTVKPNVLVQSWALPCCMLNIQWEAII